MKLRLIIILAAFFINFTAFSQNIDIQKIDNFVSHIENNNRGVGSVSIFKDGKEIYNRSFGQMKLDNVQYNGNTKYQIGSVTKLITATLIYELIESNKLLLDDKLSKFYPNIPNSDKITIKSLLGHTSGLGDYVKDGKWLNEKVSDNKIFEEIIKQGVTFQPGEKISYSNSGYFLLAKILERLSNQDYATIVKEKIVKPINLKNFTATNYKVKNTFASYSYINKWDKINEFEFSNVIGVGNISSTTKDLNTFLYNLFNYKFVTKASVEEMKPIIPEMFGRGLMYIPFYNHIFYGHGGDTYGTHSVVEYNEKDHLGLSIAINGERFPHNDFAIGLLSIIYDSEYKFPVFNTITLRLDDLNKYLGTYSASNFPLKLLISVENNNLIGQVTGQSTFLLECYEINKFKFEALNVTLEFHPEENRMTLTQDGQKFILIKE